jgi:hypothetical protein
MIFIKHSIARKALNNAFDVANNGSHVQTNMFVNWSDLAQPQFSWYRPNTDAGPTLSLCLAWEATVI